MEYVNEEQLKNEIILLQQSKRLAELTNLKSLAEQNPEEKIIFPHDEYNNLISQGVQINYSKQKFGEMVLLIVTNLAKSGKFAGYTWKEDFYSNALEKILSYAVNNFDATLISKRSDKNVKAFAYLTQIANNAFIEIINKRKEEIKMMEQYIVPLSEFYELFKIQYTRHKFEDERKESHEVEVYLGDFDTQTSSINVYVGRDKDFSIDVNPLDYSHSEIYTIIKENEKYSIHKFTSIYDILLSLKDKRVKLINKNGIISVEEYEKIKDLNFQYLNITAYSNKYQPSFPKKEKKIRDNFFEGWE